MKCDCCGAPATVEADGGHLCAACDTKVEKMTEAFRSGGVVRIHVEETGETLRLRLRGDHDAE